MNELYSKAKRLGATDFGKSKKKNKRFYVIYDGKIINFGSSIGKTYYDHKDKLKREAWYARHSKIKDKNNKYVINNPYSPSYWSNKILWT
jgi:hypothetical protein